ncbi:conserved Plasmodium protein, unknown function [Plasmodium gaboni]|uniref:Uncharacterized protein n=1 Tax=Plasmodium gaboni TaxID=647221 RepID=A0ABY1UN69_9APIC|nr:conserved Plasmodium protein, unknown function [Plasmodium gaboni]
MKCSKMLEHNKKERKNKHVEENEMVEYNKEKDINYICRIVKKYNIGKNLVGFGGAFTRFANESIAFHNKTFNPQLGIHMNVCLFNNELFQNYYIKLIHFSRWHILVYLSNKKLYVYKHSRYVWHVEHFNEWKQINVPTKNEIINIQIVSCNYQGDLYFDNITNDNKNFNIYEQKENDDYYDHFYYYYINNILNNNNNNMSCNIQNNQYDPINLFSVYLIDNKNNLYVGINSNVDSQNLIITKIKIIIPKYLKEKNFKIHSLLASLPEINEQHLKHKNIHLNFSTIIELSYNCLIKKSNIKLCNTFTHQYNSKKFDELANNSSQENYERVQVKKNKITKKAKSKISSIIDNNNDNNYNNNNSNNNNNNSNNNNNNSNSNNNNSNNNNNNSNNNNNNSNNNNNNNNNINQHMFMPEHNYHDDTQSSVYNNTSIFNKNNPFPFIDSYNDTPQDFTKIKNKQSNNIHYNINTKRFESMYCKKKIITNYITSSDESVTKNNCSYNKKKKTYKYSYFKNEENKNIQRNSQSIENDNSIQEDTYENNQIINKKIYFVFIKISNNKNFRIKLINSKPQKLISGTSCNHGCILFENKEIYFWLYHQKEDKFSEENKNDQLRYIHEYNRSYNNNKNDNSYISLEKLKSPKVNIIDVCYCNNTYIMLSEDNNLYILKYPFLRNLRAVNFFFYINNYLYKNIHFENSKNFLTLQKLRNDKLIEMYITDYILITVHSTKDICFTPFLFQNIYIYRDAQYIDVLSTKYEYQIKNLLKQLGEFIKGGIENLYTVEEKKKFPNLIKYEMIDFSFKEKNSFTLYITPNALIVCIYNVIEYYGMLDYTISNFLSNYYIV